jgi:hypothetical protein
MPTYSYNPTGATGPNNINNEAQTLAPVSGWKHNFLIPIYAPFFLDTVQISIVPTAQSLGGLSLGVPNNLQLGVHFFPGLEFVDATNNCGKPIFGAICFTDPELAGEVTISYLTLGGIWIPTRARELIVINRQNNPRVGTWEDEFSVTSLIPPVSLSYNKQQLTGFDAITGILTDIANLLISTVPLSSPLSFNEHITNYNNPHGDTALTYGLGKVPNWQVASDLEAKAGTAYNLFVTPRGAAQALTSPSVLHLSSPTAFGITKLNLGGLLHDDTDSAKALTASGLLNMKNAPGSNAIKTLFSYERQIVNFTPFPIPYPVSCLGQTCHNFGDLVAAVQNNLGLSPIQHSARRGCIWLPYDMSTPNLTMTLL